MARFFFSKLNDVLAEVRFDGRKSLGFQMAEKVDFLAHHALAFGDDLGLLFATDAADDGAGLVGVSCPVNLPAIVLNLLFKLGQVGAKVFQNMVPYLRRPVPHRLEFR